MYILTLGGANMGLAPTTNQTLKVAKSKKKKEKKYLKDFIVQISQEIEMKKAMVQVLQQQNQL